MSPTYKSIRIFAHTIDAHLPSCRSPLAALLPVMAAVFIAFLIIGLALPVLPLHVHHGLGLSMFVVGLVTGSQFAAAIISRVWAGNFADTRGAKQAVVIGLGTAVASGLFYLLSLAFTRTPVVSVSMLLLGRAVLGGAESFIITGAVTWGLAILGQEQAGRVIAWMGMAMFAALAPPSVRRSTPSVAFLPWPWQRHSFRFHAAACGSGFPGPASPPGGPAGSHQPRSRSGSPSRLRCSHAPTR
jgi:MFS family permease